MTCKNVQEMIPRYLSGDLSVDELEEFMHHVRECSTCYDELETHFMIKHVLHYLDVNDQGTLDLKQMMVRDMQERRDQILTKRLLKKSYFVLLAFGAAATLFFLLDFFGILTLTNYLL